MQRFMLPLLTALAAGSSHNCAAQRLQGRIFESAFAVPVLSDSLRIWHRYQSDSTVVLLIPGEANPGLRRGYEFLIPIGRISNPVQLGAECKGPDTLTLSCTASDYFSSGYRLIFIRDKSGFGFHESLDFQVFRSGVERVCKVPLRLREKPDRLLVTPVSGSAACSYIYHRQLLISYPDGHYAAP